eukprot:4094697-Pyramimonas_sp.AAC.1
MAIWAVSHRSFDSLRPRSSADTFVPLGSRGCRGGFACGSAVLITLWAAPPRHLADFGSGKWSARNERVEAKAELFIVQSLKTVTKKPGYSIYERLEDYEEDHGDFETNGKKRLGHYKDTRNGKDVWIVPDRRITRVEFNEESGVEKRLKAGSADDDVAPGFLDLRQRHIADAMVTGFRGNFVEGHAIDALLGVPDESGTPSPAPR